MNTVLLIRNIWMITQMKEVVEEKDWIKIIMSFTFSFHHSFNEYFSPYLSAMKLIPLNFINTAIYTQHSWYKVLYSTYRGNQHTQDKKNQSDHSNNNNLSEEAGIQMAGGREFHSFGAVIKKALSSEHLVLDLGTDRCIWLVDLGSLPVWSADRRDHLTLCRQTSGF